MGTIARSVHESEKGMKLLRRTIAVLLLLLLLAALALWLYSQQVLPVTDGSLRLAGRRKSRSGAMTNP